MLEWSDEENRFMAMHHPFTMPMEEDWDKIDTDPGSVRAKAYDIVLNGRSWAEVRSESTRMIYRRRCLKFWALRKNRPGSSSASC